MRWSIGKKRVLCFCCCHVSFHPFPFSIVVLQKLVRTSKKGKGEFLLLFQLFFISLIILLLLFSSLIDLIVFMDEEGFVPDHHIRHALVRALTPAPPVPPVAIDGNQSFSFKNDGMNVGTAEHSADLDSAQQLKKEFGIEPAEVWQFQNWSSLRRFDSEVILRSSFAPSQLGGTVRLNEPDNSSSLLTNLLFPGPVDSRKHRVIAEQQPNASQRLKLSKSKTVSTAASHKSSSGGGGDSGAGVPEISRSDPPPPPLSSPPNNNSNQQHVSHRPGVSPIRQGGSVDLTSNPSSANPQNNPSPKRTTQHWSANLLEGIVPVLQWKDIGRNPPGETQRRTYAGTKKLHRLVRLSEDLLARQCPDLSIDIQSGGQGMHCPGTSCGVQRALTISEISQGWESYHGDANKYTTRCVYCGREFIPRFCLQSSPPVPPPVPNPPAHSSFPAAVPLLVPSNTTANPEEDREVEIEALPPSLPSSSSSSPLPAVSSAPQWFEFLSPWVLHKEILNIIFEDGIIAILLNDFKSNSHQKSVVFWNMIIHFRLRGLPFSFLLTKASLVDAFPANEAQHSFSFSATSQQNKDKDRSKTNTSNKPSHPSNKNDLLTQIDFV
jgi:hypothetical protein